MKNKRRRSKGATAANYRQPADVAQGASAGYEVGSEIRDRQKQQRAALDNEQEKKTKHEEGYQQARAASDNAEWKRLSRPLLDGGQGKKHNNATILIGLEKRMTSVAAKNKRG